MQTTLPLQAKKPRVFLAHARFPALGGVEVANYRIATTSTQEKTMMAAMRKGTIRGYSVLSNNCATVANEALAKGGFDSNSWDGTYSPLMNLPLDTLNYAAHQGGTTKFNLQKGATITDYWSEFDR